MRSAVASTSRALRPCWGHRSRRLCGEALGMAQGRGQPNSQAATLAIAAAPGSLLARLYGLLRPCRCVLATMATGTTVAVADFRTGHVRAIDVRTRATPFSLTGARTVRRSTASAPSSRPRSSRFATVAPSPCAPAGSRHTRCCSMRTIMLLWLGEASRVEVSTTL